ncbi:pyridoxamine 5'-phosphate oxidase family protein [Actinoplanes bogorensis]|uniref:Pyridoxamine 5'-phosphate oxidase family protein n=1 Tax=Paractinoplanes bogorensis TaxID=1610840 RepID=A0ABS5Z2J7_9ACTN|nr:pyridoxamine 5'-phosphate oxidase family protein [Actinoplanes bogorensis]MBU2669924.1 pyridoxamine 5'-phosphate oxidase family protein [Actinoplanes bogorensis]
MTPYHRGELIAQQRAGLLDEAAHVSVLINDEMPRAGRAFLAEQPMLVVGAVDRNGAPWATLLTGEPGFITVTGRSTITVAAAPAATDPLHDVLAGPARVGLIAIEPGTRRRIRMNGTARPASDGLRIELAQIYPNCPKYIQRRVPVRDDVPPGVPRLGTRLTAGEMGFINATDTFFVATADPEGNADASHRGGNPGFLRALSPTRLRWPDYVGNSMFNTFGNLEVNPRAGLLLPDWSTGTLTHLTGTAVVDWDPAHAAAVPGAQRLVDFTVERVVRIDHASPLRWTEPEYSRFNPLPARAGNQ